MHHVQSPRTDDAGIESAIQAAGKTAPRVTPADLEANIVSAHYFTAMHGLVGANYPGIVAGVPVRYPLDVLTFCVLVLRNGFTVTGESAPASPQNFDPEIGKRIAFENAKQKVWPLMGYALKERLFEQAQPTDFRERVRAEHRELNERLGRLETFIDGAVFASLPEDEQTRLRDQSHHMRGYSTRIAAFGG
jgi:hypothetical protein